MFLKDIGGLTHSYTRHIVGSNMLEELFVYQPNTPIYVFKIQM